MNHTRVTEVDERTSGWETESATYYVYIQTVGGPDLSRTTSVYEIESKNFFEVFAWATDATDDEHVFAVAVAYDDASKARPNLETGRGLIWLFGHDRNDA